MLTIGVLQSVATQCTRREIESSLPLPSFSVWSDYDAVLSRRDFDCNQVLFRRVSGKLTAFSSCLRNFF